MTIRHQKSFRVFRYAFALCLLCLTSIVIPAHAASAPQFILTWQAKNSYPSNYSLKADATGNTPITVSLAAIQDGKFVDLSNTPVTWWRDSSYFANGVGKTSLTFNVEWRFKPPGTSYSLRAVVTYGGKKLDAAISIPIEPQRVVLQTPYFNNTVPRGSTVTVTAVPYFFNVGGLGDLAFSWTINGKVQTPANGENTASVTVSNDEALVGSYVPLYVKVTNVAKLEQADMRTNLVIQ